MTAETAIAGVILVALVFYALGGGADFGGGVWDLLAHGRTASRQRDLIAHAIGPIWEANHVWLILVVVLLFVCFPVAFAAIATALHIPITLALIGIVLRGSAFTFRSYDSHADLVQRRWGRVFAIASTVTPVTLGIAVGAIASGRIRVDPATARVTTGFFETWLAPFPFALGFFCLALFAYLAAVYLTLETRDRELQDAFRRRALAAAIVVGALAAVSLMLSVTGAPRVHDGLTGRGWSVLFHVATGAAALAVMAALWTRRFALARALAIAHVALILAGWAFAQYPYVIEPDLTVHDHAAPPTVLRAVLIALAAGAVVLLPSLAYLYKVFKGERGASAEESKADA